MKTLNLTAEEILTMDQALTEEIMRLKTADKGRIIRDMSTLPEGRRKNIDKLLNLRDKVREL
jgi:hypothetical protein